MSWAGGAHLVGLLGLQVTPSAEHLSCMTNPRIPGNRQLPKTSDISCPAPSLGWNHATPALQLHTAHKTSRSFPKGSWSRCLLLWEPSTLSQLPATAVLEQKPVHSLLISSHSSQTTLSKAQNSSDKGSKYETTLQWTQNLPSVFQATPNHHAVLALQVQCISWSGGSDLAGGFLYHLPLS